MKIIPLGKRIVVEVIKKQTTTNSGFVTTADPKDERTLGKVVELNKLNELELNIGEIVAFGQYVGEIIEDLGVTYKIIKEEDIVARIEN